MTGELPRIGAELAGYRLESLVSRGGMAVVYLAEDVRLGRKVAMKILAAELAEDDAFRERFLRESRIAASIDHPNVIPVYDAGESGGVLYIAMRHVKGGDLRALIRIDAPLEVDRAVSIATQVASGLEAAHRGNLVHRDIKPANVLLIPRRSLKSHDHVYLSDFGLAKHSTSVSGLTSTGQFLGTVNYCAPEQAEGKPVDHRADIYALGCMLFECLTGRPPFKKEEDLAIVMAHIREQPPLVTELVSGIPPALAEVVATMLAKSPDDRHQTCDELIEALAAAAPAGTPSVETITRSAAAAAAADPVSVPPASESRPPSPPAASADPEPSSATGPNHGRKLIAGGVAALALAAIVVVLLTRGSGEDPAELVAGPAPETRTGEAPATGSAWRVRKGAPTSRQQAAAAVLNGRIWLLGGLTGETGTEATREVEAYDPAIDTWTPGPDLPVALHHPTAVTYGGELVVIGGWAPKGADLTASTSDRVFALRDGAWTDLPSLGQPRAAGAAAVVGDEIVVVGGQNAGELVAATEIFDGERWRAGADIPTPREHLSAASESGQGHLYAVGGRALSADQNSGALERYDPGADRWTKLPSMPTPSGSLGAAIVDRRLVTVGGETPTSVINIVQSYDIATEEWSKLPSLLEPRHGLAVVAIGNTLYALGGAGAPTHAESSAAAEALDFQ
ncbi:MAG: protein kinase [Thermoleophilaceae bacterium]|nr:protein kinase [Thermoleophilaceae bacterium]